MNVETGAVRTMDTLTPHEAASGEWVPVSPVVADRLRAGEALEGVAAERGQSVREIIEELKAYERGR